MTPATVLILVDVINDFFDERGPNFYPRVVETIEPLAELLAVARETDAMVVHAVERHRKGFADAEQPKLPIHCLEGSFEADFFPGFEPDLARSEVVVAKRRYSSFFATDLALLLQEQGIKRVLIAGVKTNVCIRATSQDAFANGFEVVVPRQSTNSNRQHLEEASLEDIDRYLGQVVDFAVAKQMLSGDS